MIDFFASAGFIKTPRRKLRELAEREKGKKKLERNVIGLFFYDENPTKPF
jgi:hypothetical protein